ncbi:MAG: 5-formyltetrahydrofolate cyclo-ligase [Betaproteobacteria bacterium]
MAGVTSPPTDPAGAQHAGIRDAKRAMRDRVLAARDALSPATRHAAGAAIAASLEARPDFRAASVVLLTLPFGNEWDASLLVASALASGRTVVLPRVNTSERVLELFALTDLARDVEAGYRGIPEPRLHCGSIAPDAIEWIMVPGVAFDLRCRRLGYGGGYYDRLMISLPTRAPRVGAAFDVQIVDEVPVTAHDLEVDAVVSEARTLVRAQREGMS